MNNGKGERRWVKGKWVKGMDSAPRLSSFCLRACGCGGEIVAAAGWVTALRDYGRKIANSTASVLVFAAFSWPAARFNRCCLLVSTLNSQCSAFSYA